MASEFNDGMTFVFPCFVIFGNIYAIDETKRLKELSYLKVSQWIQSFNKTLDINSIILLPSCMVILRGQCISSNIQSIFIILLFELCCCCLSIFFCLRRLYHNSLTVNLLTRHSHGHKNRFRSIKLNICDPNTQNGLIWLISFFSSNRIIKGNFFSAILLTCS